jgi:hypothetical protein
MDEHGRLLTFTQGGASGDFAAAYADTGESRDSQVCFIDGVQCWAEVAHFGGIVIQPYVKTVIKGVILPDPDGRDFLIMYCPDGFKTEKDVAMYYLHVASLFSFPVVLAWIDTHGWNVIGHQKWKHLAEQISLSEIHWQDIPIHPGPQS